MSKHVYLTIRVDIPLDADPDELVSDCDYTVTHPSIGVIDTEIVDYEVK